MIRSLAYRTAWLGVLGGFLLLAPGCARLRPSPADLAAAGGSELLAISDALETLIDAGQDTSADRRYALECAQRRQEDTAAANLACAVIIGRYVQMRGLRAVGKVREIERCARRSRELDPEFRNGAAQRLLGTLYVLSPARALKHGDSEKGLEMLEELVSRYPDSVIDRLRLAEAYVALGDPEEALPHLCFVRERSSELSREERNVLGDLLHNRVLSCPEAPQ